MLCIHNKKKLIFRLYKHYYYNLQDADMTSLKAAILEWLVVLWWHAGQLEVVRLQRWVVIASSAIGLVQRLAVV